MIVLSLFIPFSVKNTSYIHKHITCFLYFFDKELKENTETVLIKDCDALLCSLALLLLAYVTHNIDVRRYREHTRLYSFPLLHTGRLLISLSLSLFLLD
jgi:putative effector of murein hydrolase